MEKAKITLVSLVHESCRRYPSHTAVVYDDGKGQSQVTYSQLHASAEKITRCLRVKGVMNEVIGVMVSRSHHIPAVLMGIMNVPCAFISLDEQITASRIHWLVQSLHIRIVLSSLSQLQVHMNLLKEFEPSVITIDELGLTVIKIRVTAKQSPYDLAYVITTSGTTGHPKLVKVPHQCIVPNIIHLSEIYNLSTKDVVLQFAPMTFDPSIVEIFTTLSVGAKLILVPEEVKMVPSKLLHVMTDRQEVSVLQCTTSAFHRFGLASIRTHLLGPSGKLRLIALGGEPFPSMKMLRGWMMCGSDGTCPDTCCFRVYNGQLSFINLYGITEVSSWASWYQITPKDLRTDVRTTTIGEPLMGTIVKVNENTGELLLGGDERVCLLDDESTITPRTLRPTGDFVSHGQDGRLYYLGRKDEQMKRLGKRINLVELEQEVMNLSSSIPYQAAALWGSNEERLTLCLCTDSRNCNADEISLRDAVMRHLTEVMPRYFLPDSVVILDSFPATAHGKVDKNKLLKLAEYQQQFDLHQLAGVNSVKEAITKLWMTHTHQYGSSTQPSDDHNFVAFGGNSISALQFVSECEKIFHSQFPLLVEKLLNGTFGDLIQYFNENTVSQDKVLPAKHYAVNGYNSVEKNPILEVSQASKKDLMVKPVENSLSHYTFTTSRQCKQMTIKPEKVTQCEPLTTTSQFVLVDDSGKKSPKEDSKAGVDSVGMCCPLQKLWSYDTGKCVDASPLIAVTSTGQACVLIGSHSGQFSAISMATGNALWETQLADRIESSAAISICGSYVIIGCYDGNVYVLNSMTGDEFWRYSTGGSVKCSPCVHPDSGAVYIGSHDRHIYCLDIPSRSCMWRRRLDGGSIFASPCLSLDGSILIVGTLAGNVWALNSISGGITWNFLCDKPVFSSPAVTSLCVLVGCVNGILVCLEVNQGQQMWSYRTDGPIFSSPCVWPLPTDQSLPVSPDLSLGVGTPLTSSEHQSCKRSGKTKDTASSYKLRGCSQFSDKQKECVIVGSHDCHVYCLTMEGRLQWKYKTSSAVYSSPYVIRSKTTASHVEYVVCVDTEGVMYILDLVCGSLKTKLSLPGNVFSSPVSVGGRIVIGCRDDYVYCLQGSDI